MILKALTLENFKGIGNPVRIEFAPLTLLFGPNNAGKSTIVQALMYAREVLERNNCDATTTKMGGTVADLGGFRSLVHEHDLTKSIRMRFELKITQLPYYLDAECEEDLYVDFDDLSQEMYFTHDDLSAALEDAWIEVEVTWLRRLQAPTVTTYAVGSANAEIFRIVLGDDGRARVLSTETTYVFELNLDALDERTLRKLDNAAFDFEPEKCDLAPGWEAVVQARYPLNGTLSAEGPDAALPEPIHWNGHAFSWRIIPRHLPHRFIRDVLSLTSPGPNAGDFCSRPVPMGVRDTALPSWREKLLTPSGEVWTRTWKAFRSSKSNFKSADALMDYVSGMLTSLITGPGECLRDALVESVYLSSSRAPPARLDLGDDGTSIQCWASGKAAWQALQRDESSLVSRVNNWLSGKEQLNANYEIVVPRYRELPDDSKVWQALSAGSSIDADWLRGQLEELRSRSLLRVRDVRTGSMLAPLDLGFGFSQMVPVIVAALRCETGTVAIEEPESNIHPAFQVVLADLFITQAKANPNALFLIETHSEHLMLRCLRRIRETAKGILPEGIPSVSPDDIAVHFVEATKEGPRIERKEIDEDGDFIDEWPGGFFEESFHEKFAGR